MQNHTNIGYIDFRSKNSFSILLWKTSTGSTNISMKLISSESLKGVVSGITNIVGRIKKLPKWTQEGAIVGLQGGQEKILDQYEFLKSHGIPIKAVWMQDWVGTTRYEEGVRLNWNWQLNREYYPKWDEMVQKWST